MTLTDRPTQAARLQKTRIFLRSNSSYLLKDRIDFPNDRELEAAVELCRRGDIDALEVIYRRHRDLVFRLCCRMARDQAEAEDWTQEVFLRVFEKIGSYDARAKFSTWLYRVTVNLCLDRLKAASRREKPLELVVKEHSDADPSERLLQEEKHRRVRQELNRLSSDLRAILILREFEGLSYSEISQVLDIPEGTVGSRIHQARQTLARRLRHKAGERP